MTPSQKRRAANEVVFKKRNEEIERLAKNVLDKQSRVTLPLKFLCECADERCTDEIKMSVEEYQLVRANSRQFIVKIGHEQKDIESVTKYRGYLVVEKYEQPPSQASRLSSTH
jgi:hypothetical protein